MRCLGCALAALVALCAVLLVWGALFLGDRWERATRPDACAVCEEAAWPLPPVDPRL